MRAVLSSLISVNDIISVESTRALLLHIKSYSLQNQIFAHNNVIIIRN